MTSCRPNSNRVRTLSVVQYIADLEWIEVMQIPVRFSRVKIHKTWGDVKKSHGTQTYALRLLATGNKGSPRGKKIAAQTCHLSQDATVLGFVSSWLELPICKGKPRLKSSRSHVVLRVITQQISHKIHNEHQKFATKNTCLKKDILSPVVCDHLLHFFHL